MYRSHQGCGIDKTENYNFAYLSARGGCGIMQPTTATGIYDECIGPVGGAVAYAVNTTTRALTRKNFIYATSSEL